MPATDIDRFPIYEEYVRYFGSDRSANSRSAGPVSSHRKLDQEWIPRRCCYQDWILSVYACRWSRTRYDVGLFLAEDHALLQRGSGVKAGLMFLLSDAYHHTGRMELTFVGGNNGARPSIHTGHEPGIPDSIKVLGRKLGIPVEGQVFEGHGRDRGLRLTRLDDATGRALYAKITGFSDRAVKALCREDSQLDLTRACFIVQRGVWSVEQVEFIAQEAYDPPRLLEGGIDPENRLSFQHDLVVLRTALLWERTKTVFEILSGAEGTVVECTRWADSVAELSANRDLCVQTMSGNEEIALNMPTRVLLLPRQRQGYELFRAVGIQAIKATQAHFVVVTRDFRGQDVAGFQSAGAKIVCVHDALADVDHEIYRRLARSVSTQRKMPEHPE